MAERQPYANEHEFQALIELHDMAEEGLLPMPGDGFLPDLTPEELRALLVGLVED